jgi:metal-responsive CopG/Arc/MetJ family transcriptional regulator
MRTTIELSDDLISILHALAVKKGHRGYSKVIEEALIFYLKENEKRETGKEKILKMRGSWDGAESRETKKRLEEIRKNWKI